jgi:uracil-DNA glycosylase
LNHFPSTAWLKKEISHCKICAEKLDHEPRPVVQFSDKSKILIVGQAPGRRVHESGVPWNDKSGDRLRKWLGVNEQQFYDPDSFALLPMGFCYPGKGASGDKPPRPECAPLWHSILHQHLKNIRLTILCGQYAQKYYLQNRFHQTMTETIKKFEEFLPSFLPIPHPSPRNVAWFKANPWFERELVETLQTKTRLILG